MIRKILFSVLLTLFAFASNAQYAIGDVAKDFSLKNVDGKNISLKEMKDAKGYVVIFTCNHCPFSQLYEQRIIELDKSLKKQGFPVVAINPNDAKKVPEDSYEEMIKRAKEYKYPFPYLHDETQEVAKAFGATRTPHVYILDKDLKVRYVGAIDDDSEGKKKNKVKYVEDAIKDLLNGKDPNVKETKAIGCTIKWKA